MYKILDKQVLSDVSKLIVVEAPHVARKARPGQFVIVRVHEGGVARDVPACRALPAIAAPVFGWPVTVALRLGQAMQRRADTQQGARILGRADDMLIVRGINVFPSQIQDVISRIPQVGDHFQLILDRNKHMLDELTIEVELEDKAFTGDLKDLKAVQEHVQHELKAVLNIRTNVELLEKGSIERTAGKAKRIIDRRAQI